MKYKMGFNNANTKMAFRFVGISTSASRSLPYQSKKTLNTNKEKN